jgi:hypothetical protein
MDFRTSPDVPKKKIFTKRGAEYTRKGYDVKIKTAEKFRKKCHMVGLCETQCVEMLVENFCQATGWDDRVKTPPFFEERAQEHIKQAVGYVVKDLFPWIKK